MEKQITKDINIYKEPIQIETAKTVYNNKLKAEMISKETGIPISYIYDDSYSKKFILDRSDDWIKINNQWFFRKKIDDSLDSFNELLGQEISFYFKLETATYQIAKEYKNNYFEYCLLSKNFCEYNYDYINFDDLGIETNNKSLEERLNIIKKLCEKNNDTNYLLLQDIIKMSIRDLYSNTTDRHKLNFFFKKNKEMLRLAPLFDYECSFITPPVKYQNPLIKIDISDRKTSEIIKGDDTFQESINRLMDINIEKLLEITQEKNNISISGGLKEIFINHDKNAKNIVKSFYLRK